MSSTKALRKGVVVEPPLGSDKTPTGFVIAVSTGLLESAVLCLSITYGPLPSKTEICMC